MRRIVAIAISGALGGCQPGLSDPPAMPESGRAGLIALTHTAGEPGIALNGQLMRYRHQTAAEALHAVSPPEQGWLLLPPPPVGACVLRRARAAAAHHATVEPEDIGPLTLRPPAPLSHLPITVLPRSLPTFDFRIGGVVYDADRPQDLPYLAGGSYQLSAPGDGGPALEVSLLAPAPIRLTGLRPEPEGLRIEYAAAGPARILMARDVGPETVGLDCAAEDGQLLILTAALEPLGPGPIQISAQRIARADSPDGTAAVFLTRDLREHTLDLPETEAP